MSIFTSLYTGSSGLAAHGEAIGVVGDNIANASTIGYKASRASFEDTLGGAAANGQRFGSGVRMGGPETLFGQGSLQNTGNSLDVAIRGNGFFAVAGNHGGVNSQWYTRDGRFDLDSKGTVVNADGLRLQGYTVDGSGNFSTAPGDLNLAGQESPPKATASASIALNLDSNSIPVAAGFDPVDPTNTSSFQTSMTIYDSVGNAHRTDMYFRNQGGSTWDWHAMVDGADVGGTAGTPTQIADGTLTFNTAGALDTEVTNSSSASFVGATANQAPVFDFGDSITTNAGTGLTGTTQFAGASSVTHINQDGYAAGMLTDMKIDDDGTVMGQFSNGQSRAVARIALAEFASPQNLQRAGDQLYAENGNSGQPLMGTAGTGGRGSMSGGSLEGSNVDLGNELVTLIAYQRAYQANAKTVTTADEMLQDINNLKR
jgi:flagellar hook protein FlgE